MDESGIVAINRPRRYGKVDSLHGYGTTIHDIGKDGAIVYELRFGSSVPVRKPGALVLEDRGLPHDAIIETIIDSMVAAEHKRGKIFILHNGATFVDPAGQCRVAVLPPGFSDIGLFRPEVSRLDGPSGPPVVVAEGQVGHVQERTGFILEWGPRDFYRLGLDRQAFRLDRTDDGVLVQSDGWNRVGEHPAHGDDAAVRIEAPRVPVLSKQGVQGIGNRARVHGERAQRYRYGILDGYGHVCQEDEPVDGALPRRGRIADHDILESQSVIAGDLAIKQE